jgi:hypothetical protein
VGQAKKELYFPFRRRFLQLSNAPAFFWPSSFRQKHSTGRKAKTWVQIHNDQHWLQKNALIVFLVFGHSSSASRPAFLEFLAPSEVQAAVVGMV